MALGFCYLSEIMKLSDFNYHLPKNLIAQKPITPRDCSRLLVLDRRSGEIEHKHFYDILDYFKNGDVLVLNNSKVFPARLIGKKAGTGGKIEIFLLTPRRDAKSCVFFREDAKSCVSTKRGDSQWQCLLGGRGSREGLEMEFTKGLKCKVAKNNNDGTWEVNFNMPHKKMMELVEKIGRVPLPPYIKRSAKLKTQNSKLTNDKTVYQTVYASDDKSGSVAAPTAGFHFTPALIRKLKNKGVQFEYVTLHVGLGTFAPVKVDDIAKHKMHAEQVEIKKDAAQRILNAKKEGRRIIAVGTTSVRTLESFFKLQIKNSPPIRRTSKSQINSKSKITNPKQEIKNYIFRTNIFIYPGYKFKIVDTIITNFHLPKSTLLMLVSALAGKKNIDKAYKEAVKKKYRFYSYGDAMFIY